MTEPSMTCSLRPRRTEAGLSQGELAARVGVSRQAIVAIEAGRQVPSTAIALALSRELGCGVEDLFALPTAPQVSASIVARAPLPQGARLAVGRVDGVWVAHAVPGEDRPGDALLVGDGFDDCRASVEPLSELADLERNVLVAGCAPLLGVLAGRLGRRQRDARATWIPESSTRALSLLERAQVHVAGVHLVGVDTPGGHAAIVRRHFPARTTTLVNLTRWRQGLVVARGNPLGIREARDLLRPGLSVARREAGTGADELLRRLLGAGDLAEPLLSKGPVAAGHAEVARLVRLGVSDVGVAIEAAALAEGLDFVPLSEERFDLVVPEPRLGEPPVARLLDLLDRPAFRADAGRIAGYDLSTAGHASTVAAA